jgi:hypothetical protein
MIVSSNSAKIAEDEYGNPDSGTPYKWDLTQL